MKRAVVILVSIIMVLGLAGCRDQQEGARDHTGDREVAQEEQKNAIQVDEGIVHVEITIPATLVATDDADIDDLIEEAREKGVKEIVRNNDGTLTFKMTKAQHGKMMREMQEEIQETILDIKTDDDFVSIRDIEADSSFSTFTMKVDREAFANSFDGFATLELAIHGMLYQAFDGVEPDDLQVTVHIEDVDTGEMIDTVIYPDELEKNDTQT